MQTMKKILLVVMPYEGEVTDQVTPKFFKNSAVKYMPLGVLSLAASIPDNYQVEVLDAASKGLSLDETIREIGDYQPDILGLSVVTYRAWSMVQILKLTEAPIKVVGGPHATVNHKYILDQGADAVFVGDAEHSFVEWLTNGCPPGIFKSAPIPLDELPFPARRKMNLADYEITLNDDMLFNVGKLRLPMYSSKGCPLKCIYCDVQQKTYNFKSPERCLEEFKELIDMGATSIHILDDAFNIRKERVSKFSKLISEHLIQIDWSARGTVEIRESVIADLAAAGCKRLHVGIEHLDDNVLEYFQKSCRFRHIKKFSELCNRYGISILGYLILGAPGETEAYRKNLPQMIEELGISLPYFNVLSPLAETPFYDELLANGTFKEDHWDQFSKDPVKDFRIPSHRDPKEEEELNATVDEYVAYFQNKGIVEFVA
jgi:radical SAM superfamily enzyme YgiQ (UPF0313 family)